VLPAAISKITPFGSNAAPAVPVLVRILQSALGRLGPEATAALPDLRALLNDKWAIVREEATNAIRAIERPDASREGNKVPDKVQQGLTH
jgi:hypothetical protein